MPSMLDSVHDDHCTYTFPPTIPDILLLPPRMSSAEDPCELLKDPSLSKHDKRLYHHQCNMMTHQPVESIDRAVQTLGGFLGAADRAVNDELALEETDPSYGDFHSMGASPEQVHHAHNMQHTDIAMRAISSMLGFSHQMMAGPEGSSLGSPHAGAAVPGTGGP